MTQKTASIVLFLGSFLLAIFWNELNKNELRKAGIELRDNATVITNDDDSYLAPFDSFKKTGSFYKDDLGKYTSVIRSPGYGSIYYVSSLLFGDSKALFFLYLFQSLLFALSVSCFFLIAELFFIPRKIAFFISILYGFLPFSMGFLNYTLTEGVSPALLIFCLYFLLKGYRADELRLKYRNYLLTSVVLSFLFIVRPILGIFIFPILVVLVKDFYAENRLLLTVIRLFVFLTISLSLFGIWEIRNKYVLGHWTNLHPIYQNEVPGVFRFPHKQAWEFFKGWESSGEHFHETMVPFWDKTMAHDTSEIPIRQFIKRIPNNVIHSVGKKELINTLKSYRIAILDQKKYFDSHKVMPENPLKSEETAGQNLMNLAIKYRRQEPLNYNLLTPFHVLKTMSFHSNLSLYEFQVAFRGNIFMEALRVICLVIHFFVFLTLPISLIISRKNYVLLSITLTVLVYIGYLAFVQRGIEERYTLPILPFLILIASYSIWQVFLRIKSVQKS